VNIKNVSNHIAFFNRIKVTDKEGIIVRPIIYSDNYFTILPKMEKTITLDLSLADINAKSVDIELISVNGRLTGQP
jgi:hypothetical protein